MPLQTTDPERVTADNSINTSRSNPHLRSSLSSSSSNNVIAPAQSQHARLQSQINQLTSTMAHTRSQLVETLLQLGEITGFPKTSGSTPKVTTLVSDVTLAVRESREDSQDQNYGTEGLELTKTKRLALSTERGNSRLMHPRDPEQNDRAAAPISTNLESTSCLQAMTHSQTLLLVPSAAAAIATTTSTTSPISTSTAAQSQPKQLQQTKQATLQQAESLLARHVALLQHYNATKDAAMTLLACVADGRGVPLAEVRHEFTGRSGGGSRDGDDEGLNHDDE